MKEYKWISNIMFHFIRPRNRWLDEVREDGRMVGGEEWQAKVYDREEWKRLLRTARNHRILYMSMD